MRKAFLLLLTACGAQSAGNSTTGGNNVSFGGAQDLGQFRDILDTGGIPGPDTLDANGFFNEHFNAPPPADCGQTLCLTPGLAVGRDWLTGAHQATVQLSITTPVDPSTYHRMPMNLVLVIDRSGSMVSDGRLDKVKAGIATLIDNLQDGDHLAIVDFDDKVTVDAPLTAALDRPHLKALVAALSPRGGTDINAGVQAGFRLLGDTPAADHQNRVILLSDGNATSGIIDTSTILANADASIERGIGLTTIGVGHDFDVQLMRGLAEHGAGNFYFLEDGSAADEVFGQELDYFLTPLALDVHVTAAPGAGFTFGEVVGSHLWSGSSMTLPAVFLASRTSQTGEPGRRGGGSMIFIHATPNGHDGARVGSFELSYHLPGSTEILTQTARLDYTPDGTDNLYLSAPEMAERYAMYNMFLGFRYATQQLGQPCAAAALRATKTAATTWNAEKSDPDIAADLVLLDKYLANLGTADTGASLGTCGASDPYQGGDGAYYGDGTMACSTGGARGGLPIALALLALRRRRR